MHYADGPEHARTKLFVHDPEALLASLRAREERDVPGLDGEAEGPRHGGVGA